MKSNCFPVKSKVLKDVVALVDVKSSLGNPALAISSRLQSLGATVVRKLSSSVTHVIFRNGSENILNAANKAKKHVVTPAWVKACQTYNFRVGESSYGVTEKQDIALLNEIERSPENGTLELDRNAHKQTNQISDLSALPIKWRSLKEPKLPPLVIPKEVHTFLQRMEKHKPSRHSGDLFSDGQLSSSDVDEVQVATHCTTERPALSDQYSESPPLLNPEPVPKSPPDRRPSESIKRIGLAASTQADNAKICRQELHSELSPIIRANAANLDDLNLPKSVANRNIARRLLPLETEHKKPLDKLITPTGKSHCDTPPWSKSGRSNHLLFSKSSRLSTKTPLTPDVLLEVVQFARTPKTNKKENKTPQSDRLTRTTPRRRVVRVIPSALTRKRRTPHAIPDLVTQSENSRVHHDSQSARPKSAKKRVSFSNELLSPSKGQQVEVKRSRSQRVRIPSAARSNEAAVDPSFRTPVTGVDLDESRPRLSTPRTLCLPRSAESSRESSANDRDQTLSRHPYSTTFVKPNIRMKTVTQVEDSTRPIPSRERTRMKENEPTTGSTASLTIARRKSTRLNSRFTESHLSTKPSIYPLTTRNSLDDFDLNMKRLKRRLNRIKQPDSSIRSSEELVLAFTGLRRDEELTLRTLVTSSSLTGYRFVDSGRYLEPTDTHSPMGQTHPAWSESPTHLVTCNPFRRTLNLLRGLLCNVTIVTVDWLRECALCGTWLSPIHFKPDGLPRDCKRQRCTSLFSAYTSVYVGPISHPPTSDLIQLLELGGAKITSRKLNASVLIGCTRSGAVSLKPSWVLDSIVKGHPQSVAQYTIS